MSIFRRVTSFFNIQPGEERLIGLLALLYFTMALGFVLVQSMAFGVFIAEYGPQGLPYSYISIAFLASLAAVLYIKIGERVSFSRLLFINLAFLGIVSLLIWVGLNSPFSHNIAFFLPLWFQIVVNQGNLAVWSLAIPLFDFQQGKRLFPLLGAGMWLGNIIGGVLVPFLVGLLGAVNLLPLAMVSFGISLFVLRVISRSYLQQPSTEKQSRHAQRPTKQPKGLFKERYILLIFAYVVLWWVAFFFLDNIFYDRAAAQYPDANQLTAFTGQFVSITGIIALIASSFLNSRIISRFGLRAGLVAMPLFVIITLGILAFSGSLGMSLFLVFMLGTFAKLLNVAFGFSLSQSANAIVYQSLPDTIRARVQATAEGIVQPIAIGLAGLSLLALTAGLKFNYIGLSFVFLGLGAAWLTVIFLLSGNYVNALTQAITKRRLGDSPTVIADPASIALLQSRLHDPHPSVSIYALTKLESLDQQAVINELPNLIRHSAPEVRREAFARVENLKLRTVLDAVRKQLAIETIPSVKESALRALGAIADSESFPELSGALNETDVHSLRGALIGLLKYGNESIAGQRLKRLLDSPSAGDRILAAQILGDVNRGQLQDAHQTLLRDADPKVRRDALESAGKIRQRSLYPLILEACDLPETSRAAGLALASAGTDALPEIESAFSKPDAHRQSLLILSKALGRIGGQRSCDALLTQINSPDNELRAQIFHALGQSGYRAKDVSGINHAVKAEIEQSAWICAAQVDLGETNETSLLYSALKQLFAQARDRVLLLLSFAYDANSILRVREALLTDSAAQLSYALEIIDTQLPAELKQMVMPLVEELSPQERLQRLGKNFMQPQQTCEERLRTIIEEDEQFTPWARACAMYTSARLYQNIQKGDNAMLSMIEKVLILKSVNMFSQTPDHVLADVANLLEEVEAPEGETIFKKGDLGDSMYVIVDGKVRVHDGKHLLNYLGERDVFGEMALLDPEPRIASVTAVESTRLFRLDQAPFYELIAERPEVATGIIRVLTGHLRNRVRDIAQLDARVKELESGTRV